MASVERDFHVNHPSNDRYAAWGRLKHDNDHNDERKRLELEWKLERQSVARKNERDVSRARHHLPRLHPALDL